MAEKYNFTIDQGANLNIALSLSNLNEDIELITYTPTASLRKHYSSNSYHTFTCSVTDTNEISISMSANTTANITAGRYVYDVVITKDNEKIRAIEGLVTVTPAVTR
jgi:hypothetical protein